LPLNYRIIGQQAAGTLSYLHSSVLPNLLFSPGDEEIPQDLFKDFIKGLELLMLAQAQECSWQLAKLSMLHCIIIALSLNSFRPIQEFFDC
jgi:programmed cell death 6-interacting protein